MATKKVEKWKTLINNISCRGTEYDNMRIIDNGTVKIKITHSFGNGHEHFKGEVFTKNKWKFLFGKLDLGSIAYTEKYSYVQAQATKEQRTSELLYKGMEFINLLF